MSHFQIEMKLLKYMRQNEISNDIHSHRIASSAHTRIAAAKPWIKIRGNRLLYLFLLSGSILNLLITPTDNFIFSHETFSLEIKQIWLIFSIENYLFPTARYRLLFILQRKNQSYLCTSILERSVKSSFGVTGHFHWKIQKRREEKYFFYELNL